MFECHGVEHIPTISFHVSKGGSTTYKKFKASISILHRPPEGDRREVVPERKKREKEDDSGYLADAVVSCCSFDLRGGFASPFSRSWRSFLACGGFVSFIFAFGRFAHAAVSFLTNKRQKNMEF